MAEYFDRIAGRYDDWYRTKTGMYIDRIEKWLVFSMLQSKSGKALDLGCGTGNYTLELKKRGFDVIGLDASEGMLGVARSKGLNCIKGDAYSLPFPDESFDLVLSVTMFEFIYEPEIVVAEISRVLKPGGEVIIGTMNGRSAWFLFKRLKSLFVETAYRYARFYTPGGLEDLLRDAGFTDVRSGGVIFFPSFWPFHGLAESLDRKLHHRCKDIAAFIAVRGVKP
ncbi:class I SAM-dependent methyltransferase [Thermococcus thioreducens]|uniref:Ubiquinone biosynthesis protein UbiE n=1 Tax=Thermococcus thioreducens TaxID=277988 RepID=A0A0Q2S4N0_9EURY|nr:class I SAM-dependent methyltransferase [Thermococcus thioreducens]ASJ12584.1 ubiquinone biosynthesis protein UbiE [Thermococcus thioreducens]KQH82419.1 ubiquinone biosynthesis protein UbiE [Thermococcus thioreducens]SEV88309.1 Ubiquinone/menaquinone biosynthesis C-methylase UbiE [Thermococcus thioreducens]